MTIRVLLPGDELPTSSVASATTSLRLGPGLQSLISTSSLDTTSQGKGKEREVYANRAGALGHQTDHEVDKWWIEGQTKRVSYR